MANGILLVNALHKEAGARLSALHGQRPPIPLHSHVVRSSQPSKVAVLESPPALRTPVLPVRLVWQLDAGPAMGHSVTSNSTLQKKSQRDKMKENPDGEQPHRLPH